ncbi:hypothetical protein Hanom_Chr09g00813371 [Helianthus anomalus]
MYITYYHNTQEIANSIPVTGEHDEAEKTFAIIVGLLAGVALIIIFLTFMRKAFGRHGK